MSLVIASLATAGQAARRWRHIVAWRKSNSVTRMAQGRLGPHPRAPTRHPARRRTVRPQAPLRSTRVTGVDQGDLAGRAAALWRGRRTNSFADSQPAIDHFQALSEEGLSGRNAPRRGAKLAVQWACNVRQRPVKTSALGSTTIGGSRPKAAPLPASAKNGYVGLRGHISFSQRRRNGESLGGASSRRTLARL